MLCRICLKNTISDDLIPLFGGSFPHKIEVISSVKLVDENDFPSMLCTRCALNINLAFNFRLVIIDSNLILQRDNDTEIEAQASESECSSVKSTSESIRNDNGILDDITLDAVVKQEVNSGNGNDKRLNNKKLHECNRCDYKHTNYWQLCRHRRTSHAIEPIICTTCGKSLLPANMKRHIVTHYAPPASCKVCGFTSKNAASLKAHMMYHSEHKRICHICGKVYAHSSRYLAHMRWHTTPKRKIYKCHLCERLFADKGTLKRHIRTHTGERPYICEFCKKGFSSPNALKTHRRQHTKERPYACKLCPKAFPQRVSLRTHMKSKHHCE